VASSEQQREGGAAQRDDAAVEAAVREAYEKEAGEALHQAGLVDLLGAGWDAPRVSKAVARLEAQGRLRRERDGPYKRVLPAEAPSTLPEGRPSRRRGGVRRAAARHEDGEAAGSTSSLLERVGAKVVHAGSVTEAALAELAEAERLLHDQRVALLHRLTVLRDAFGTHNFNPEMADVEAFLNEPYVALQVPGRHNEFRVIAPRFIPFHVGMLEFSTATYNVFKVNQYVLWLGNVPEALRKLFDFKPLLDAKLVDDELVLGSKAEQEEAFDRYRDHVTMRKGDVRIGIRKGHEFALLSKLIKDGILPFVPKAVAAEDLRPAAWSPLALATFEKRDYQERAWTHFLTYGAAGFWMPTGSGKTLIALRACAELKGRKGVIVPTRTLVDQWRERLDAFLTPEAAAQVEVWTYQSYKRLKESMRNKTWVDFTFLVFDEAHHAAADDYSRWVTVPTKYRNSLSASPNREDGRENEMFAFAGPPFGTDWRELEELGVVELPDVHLHLVRDLNGKLIVLDELLKKVKPTVVFSDSLALGERLAERYGAPFIQGSTTKRMDKFREALLAPKKLVIASRVGDEGLSLEMVERTIEVDFHAGSRRQELQRAGRVMHGQGDETGVHHIIMTEEEHAQHGKRLLSLREKGMRIAVHRAR